MWTLYVWLLNMSFWTQGHQPAANNSLHYSGFRLSTRMLNLADLFLFSYKSYWGPIYPEGVGCKIGLPTRQSDFPGSLNPRRHRSLRFTICLLVCFATTNLLPMLEICTSKAQYYQHNLLVGVRNSNYKWIVVQYFSSYCAQAVFLNKVVYDKVYTMHVRR